MQRLLDWDKRDRDLASLEEHLRTASLEEADVGLLLAIAREDAGRQSTSYACKSKRQWALAIGCESRNTPVAAMRRLAAAGVLVWDADRAGHEVLVDWSAVWSLEKRDPAARLRQEFDARRSEVVRGVVRGGQASARVQEQEKKARVNVNRGNRVSLRGLDARLVRPWATRGGLTGDDLRAAVDCRGQRVLSRLYWAAVEACYWEDCEDHRVRFLSLCHHAATVGRAPMALLNALCRRDAAGTVLRSERVRDESRDWAAETRRVWRRESSDLSEVFVEAERERHERPMYVCEE